MIIRLGDNRETNQPVFIDEELLKTHLHLIGATGAGKSSAIHVILRQLLLTSKKDQGCIFVFDPLGNLAQDLLKIIAYKRYSPESARERLVYVEPANDSAISTFNPLLHTDEANRYYQTMRAVDLVLRAWEAQDASQQPRLLQWMTNAFISAAEIGFPISVCQHLIHPGSAYHDAIVNRLPGETGYRWKQILKSGGNEAMRILESTRNRLDPFFRSPNLRLMFGVPESRFDCEKLIREKKIVIINLAEKGRIPGFICDTIGSLFLNEVFETANRMAVRDGRESVEPTYLFLDEFHRYVSPDIERALPTVRQMGLRLILAHQSFAQLEREEVDLRQMIWQARTRLTFANYADDADLLADQLGKMTFDDMEIKDIRTSKRQLIDGYRKELMKNRSSSTATTNATSKNSSSAENESSSFSYTSGSYEPQSWNRGKGSSSGRGESDSSGWTDTKSEGESEQLVPNHITFDEVSSVTYRNFEEHMIRWSQKIQSLGPGAAFLQKPGSKSVEPVQLELLDIPNSTEVQNSVDNLLSRNFESDLFMSFQEAEHRHESCLQKLLSGEPLNINSNSESHETSDPPNDSPFEI